MTTQALQDLTVLECGTRLSVGMCGKLLADLGAHVTKVEPIEGDPARRVGPFPGDVPNKEQSGLFAYLNRGKRGITLDLESAAGREALARLAADADIVIAGGTYEELDRWGLLYDSLGAAKEDLVCTAITPFGLTGPHRDYADSEIVVTAQSGIGYYVPGPVETLGMPPVIPGTHLTHFAAGVQAASATMVAITGGGGRQVDVSEQETFLDSLRMYLSTYAYEGVVHPRGAANQAAAVRGQTGKAADGYIASLPGPQSTDSAWINLVDAMGNPEWATQPDMFDLEYRRANAAEIIAHINEWTASMPKAEIARLMQERHHPVLPTNGIDDLLVDDQLIARKYFVPMVQPGLEQGLMPGSPIRYDGAAIVQEGRAPFLGEHTAEVLAAAGFSNEEIMWLDRSGVA